MRLKLPPRQDWYRDGRAVVRPNHIGNEEFDLPPESLPRFGTILRDNPRIEVLSDELHWFRMPEGATEISVQQQNFTPDEHGYFQAPANLAQLILGQPGFNWIGTQRPLPEKRADQAGRSGAKRKPSRELPYWARARKVALEWLRENGISEPGDGGQGRLERHIGDWLAARGHHPAESTLRARVRRWIDESGANPLTD